MSALAFNLLRIAYLALLWLFVVFAIGVLRRDITTKSRAGAPESGRKRRKDRQAAEAVPGSVMAAAPLVSTPIASTPVVNAPLAAAAPVLAPPAPAAAPLVAAPSGGYAVDGIVLPPDAPPPAGAVVPGAGSAPAKARERRKAGRAPRGGAPVVPTELVVTAGALAGTRLPLGDSSILIGRAPGSTLVINDDFASSRHARIFGEGDQWYLEDLGSTNGTFVGGQRVTGAVPLNPGNAVQIGQTLIELR